MLYHIKASSEEERQKMLIKDHKKIQEARAQANAEGMEFFLDFASTGLPPNSIYNPDLDIDVAIGSIRKFEEIVFEADNKKTLDVVLKIMNLSKSYKKHTRGSKSFCSIPTADWIERSRNGRPDECNSPPVVEDSGKNDLSNAK